MAVIEISLSQTLLSKSVSFYSLPTEKFLHAFLSSADVFFKINFFVKFFQRIPSMLNSLDPDQARHFVGPDLGPNCLQRITADNTCGQRVKHVVI